MRTLAIAALLLVLGDANAVDGMSTGEMMAGCKDTVASYDTKKLVGDQFEVGKCMGFISASRDMVSVWRASSPSVGICIPQPAQTIQIIRVFVKWAENHPEQHHERALLSFITSMREAFPCDS